MYSKQSLFTRFGTSTNSSTPGVFSNNAAHLVAVRLNGSQWQYNTNFAWRNFTPTTNDRLLAQVDFTADTVTSLAGTDSTINGIVAGYLSGDFVITPNIWNGVANLGEFGVTGTFFQVCPANRSGGNRRFADNNGTQDLFGNDGRDGLAMGYGLPVAGYRATTRLNAGKVETAGSEFEFDSLSGWYISELPALPLRFGSEAADGALLVELAKHLRRESDLELGNDFELAAFELAAVNEFDSMRKSIR